MPLFRADPSLTQSSGRRLFSRRNSERGREKGCLRLQVLIGRGAISLFGMLFRGRHQQQRLVLTGKRLFSTCNPLSSSDPVPPFLSPLPFTFIPHSSHVLSPLVRRRRQTDVPTDSESPLSSCRRLLSSLHSPFFSISGSLSSFLPIKASDCILSGEKGLDRMGRAVNIANNRWS